MRLYKILLFALLALMTVSCEDVIDVDLDTSAPRLVVDASIDWVKGTAGNEQKIVLSTTTGYYSSEFPTVSGASVTVANSAGTIFTFIETPGTGEYLCNNFEPVLGETYVMTIILNGETYTATETLMASPDIMPDIIQDNEGGISGDEVEITFYYQDDPEAENYYLFGFKTQLTAFPEYEVEDDENSNGGIMPEFYSGEDLKAGDVVNIRLYGISERYFQYMNKLLVASGADDSPWPTTPSAVRGNIVNQSNSENFSFGYFRLAEVAVRDYTIQ